MQDESNVEFAHSLSISRTQMNIGGHHPQFIGNFVHLNGPDAWLIELTLEISWTFGVDKTSLKQL